MERTSALAPAPVRPFQFTIRSLLWLMVTVAMVLAFVRPADWQHQETALVCLGIGVACAAALGWAVGRVYEVLYWTLLTFSLAVVCLAGQFNVSPEQVMAWGSLAIVVGGLAGAIGPGRMGFKVAASAGAGLLGMLLILGWSLSLEDLGDLGLALVVSCAIPILSDLFTWARGRYHTSYGGWAASLVLAVILGNWGAAWFAPFWTNLLAGR
ncbi:MAG TPA: hypothetical protein VMP01_00065 [Pirellulaceae bacterium]|nr:hypothetical protein [Pirellulaceae bacterium]